MDESKLLLKKNNKTIYWRKLSVEDENEVRRLTLDYFLKDEPTVCGIIASPGEIEDFEIELSMVGLN